MTYKKYKFIRFTKYYFYKLLILIEYLISYNLNLRKFLIKFQKTYVVNSNKEQLN